jgi:hypothetical protein
MYHWQTSSYARHKSSDSLVDSIIEITDKFMEIYQGKYGKLDNYENKSVQIIAVDEYSVVAFLRDMVAFLSSLEKKGIVKSSDTDLLNIRDDLVGQINQTMYLFSFE